MITNPEASIPPITKLAGGHDPESFAPTSGRHDILSQHATHCYVLEHFLGTYTAIAKFTNCSAAHCVLKMQAGFM